MGPLKSEKYGIKEYKKVLFNLKTQIWLINLVKSSFFNFCISILGV
jgi:hypothetical protein